MSREIKVKIEDVDVTLCALGGDFTELRVTGEDWAVGQFFLRFAAAAHGFGKTPEQQAAPTN